MNLKIAIAEPAELMRIGLGTILQRFSGFQIQLVELAQGSAGHTHCQSDHTRLSGSPADQRGDGL